MASSSPASSENVDASSARSKLLLLGDSLTQTSWSGWGGGLAHRYQRRADVLNRGMSGYNTRWYMKYAEQSGIWKESGDVKLVTIFFGANDASLKEHNPHHHVPVEEYKENLEQIASLVNSSYPNAKILFITPPPVHHGQRFAFQKQRYKEKATGVLERTLENAGVYAEACKSVAASLEQPCLDLYTLMKEYKREEATENEEDHYGPFFYDGLHFSSPGHDFVLKVLLEKIEKEYPALYVTPDPITGQENNSGSSCEGIANSGPYHDKIDHKDYEKAFGSSAAKRNAEDTADSDAKRSKTE